jgi:hypothetical protein
MTDNELRIAARFVKLVSTEVLWEAMRECGEQEQALRVIVHNEVMWRAHKQTAMAIANYKLAEQRAARAGLMTGPQPW